MTRLKNWAREVWERSALHRALLVAPPVVLLLLVGFAAFGDRPSMQFYTAQVEKGDIAQVVQATGTINAVITVQVGSQVSGNIAQLFADFNSRVKKDQVIAQIDPATFRARLLQAEADLENAKANVKSLEAQIETQRADGMAAKASVDRARAQLKEAQLNLQRTVELTEQGIFSAAQRDTAQAIHDAAAASLGVTEAQLEQARARLKATQAQFEQAKAQVAQRRAAAELARVDLDHTTIRAPIDGTVIARNVDVGQTVAASLQAPTLFIIAQDLTKMRVYAKTDEADVGKIRVGATANFRVDSFPRENFEGRVAQVRMNATTVQNVVTYDTIIEFDNPGQKLFPGMTAYVTIPTDWANDVVKIPNGALRFKPDKEVYAKHKIPYDDPRATSRPGGAGMAGRGGPGGAAGASRGGAGGGTRGSAEGGDGGPPAGGERGGWRGRSPREDWAVVWKLTAGKELQPVRVKTGVTDFTFTELKEGNLKDGDELVIGQSGGRNNAQRPGFPSGPGSPMSGPGGMPRRM